MKKLCIALTQNREQTNNKVHEIRRNLFMLRLFLLFVFLFPSVNSFAATLEEEDKELLSSKVVEYFKKVSTETHRPVSLKITLSDTFSDGTLIEDEKTLELTSLPGSVSKDFLLRTSAIFSELLPSFMEDKDPNRLMLNVTIWVNDSAHKEKVNGFCSLGHK